MVSFNRSPTWITPEFAAEFAPNGRETKFSDEQKEAWAKDPASYLTYRKNIEGSMNKFFDLQYKDSEVQKDSFKAFSEGMATKLGHTDKLMKVLIPKFAVGCRR